MNVNKSGKQLCLTFLHLKAKTALSGQILKLLVQSNYGYPLTWSMCYEPSKVATSGRPEVQSGDVRPTIHHVQLSLWVAGGSHSTEFTKEAVMHKVYSEGTHAYLMHVDKLHDTFGRQNDQ
jgi:hypothetical protein